MKLKQLISENFTKKNLVSVDLEQKLNAMLPQIFPHEDLKNIDIADKAKNKIYKAKYLPFHTRNNEWLANYIARLIHILQIKPSKDGKKSAYRMLGVVNVDDVKKYITKSERFAAARDAYEQDLVRSYIFLLRNNVLDDFYVVADEKRAILNHPRCSLLFRNRLEEAMRFLGLAEENIQIGIEKNINKWRPRMQFHTFANLYQNIPVLIDNQKKLMINHFQDWTAFGVALYKFHTDWTKLEDYNYVQAHKDVILKLGTAPKFTNSQAVALQKNATASYLKYQQSLRKLLSHLKDDKEREK